MARNETRDNDKTHADAIAAARETQNLETMLTQTAPAFENLNRNLKALFRRDRNPSRKGLFSDTR